MRGAVRVLRIASASLRARVQRRWVVGQAERFIGIGRPRFETPGAVLFDLRSLAARVRRNVRSATR